MGPVLVLDLDRTVSRFPATSRLYHRLFVVRRSPPHLAWGLVMLFLMHGLWFWSAAVRLQRRIVMSMFSRVPAERLREEVRTLVDEVAADWREGLGAVLQPQLDAAEGVFLVSHCPAPLAEGVVEALGFDGQWSVPVADYLAGAEGDVFDKVEALAELRRRFPGRPLWYFADDLVDLPCLRAADVGTLVNGSRFSRLVCRLLAPAVRIQA